MKLNQHWKTALGAALLAALMIAGAALAAVVNVDTFNDGSLTITLDPLTISGEGTVESGEALGGERDMTALITNVLPPEDTLIFASDRFNFNDLRFVAGPDIIGRGIVTWDGIDGDPLVNAQGLGPIDLTGGGTNDGFHIEIKANDLPANIMIFIHSGTDDDWCSYTLTTPGGISAPTHVDFFALFSDFTACNGAGGDATAATSVELRIDGTLNPGTDMIIDFFDADNYRDYGDLPDGVGQFASTISDASHIANGLRLGFNMDIEATKPPAPGTGANADDNFEADDEDGVFRTPGFKWLPGLEGGLLDVYVNGCDAEECYLNGWIDWNKDFDFNDPGEQVINTGPGDFPVANGAYTGEIGAIRIDVPDEVTFNTDYYARFRICNTFDTCDTPDVVDVPGGEVEDYLWSFGPNAVELAALQASSGFTGSQMMLVVGLALAVLAGLGAVVASRRTE